MATRLIQFPAVKAMTGLSRSSVYRLERRGEFPRRVMLTPYCCAWSADEIETWIEQRLQARSSTALRTAAVTPWQQLTGATDVRG